MKRIISLCNRKGGSGKTTSAVNISAALAHRGKEVLVIDADPQAHTTLSFGITPSDIKADLVSVLAEKKDLKEVMVETYLENLKVVPASRRLTFYERNYARTEEARSALSQRLGEMNGQFDYVIFDTAPTLGLLTIAALIASGEVLVPMQTHFLSMDGLAAVISLIGKLNKLYNPELKLKGIIPTFCKEKTRLSRSTIHEIKDTLGESMVFHPVRVNISLAEAPGFGKTIFQYKLKSRGAYDYLAIADQIEERT